MTLFHFITFAVIFTSANGIPSQTHGEAAQSQFSDKIRQLENVAMRSCSRFLPSDKEINIEKIVRSLIVVPLLGYPSFSKPGSSHYRPSYDSKEDSSYYTSNSHSSGKPYRPESHKPGDSYRPNSSSAGSSNDNDTFQQCAHNAVQQYIQNNNYSINYYINNLYNNPDPSYNYN